VNAGSWLLCWRRWPPSCVLWDFSLSSELGIRLLWMREYRKFAAATAIGLAVGVLYAIPLGVHFGDPLATVSSYQSKEWGGGWLFGFPFYAIIKETVSDQAPWTNLALSFCWIFLVSAGVIVMVRSAEFRAYGRDHAVEAMFLVPYLWRLYTYNYRIGREAILGASRFPFFLSYFWRSITEFLKTGGYSGQWQWSARSLPRARLWESST
jgi:hypothetical protein